MELNERNAETKSGQDARTPRQITHGVIIGGEQRKRCPRCNETQPLWEFGVCQARSDGLNLYCKACIREKIKASRVALREYKTARRQAAEGRPQEAIQRKPNMRSAGDAVWVRRAPNAAEKILRAIECGAKTQTAMRRITRLTSDAVSDAIADLMFPTDENPRIAIRFSAPAERNWHGDNHVYYRIAA